MLIDLNRELRDFDGIVLKDVTSEGKVVNATWRRTIINSVLKPENKDDGEMKIIKFELARRVYNADSEIEFSSDEVTLIKKCIYSAQPPLVCGLWNDLNSSIGTE